MKNPALLLAFTAAVWLSLNSVAEATATGAIDYVDGNGVVHGWAADTADTTTPVRVDFYVDGFNSSNFAGFVEPAQESDRSDVWQFYNWPAAKHGFAFTIPNYSPNDPSVSATFRGGGVHHVYAYAIGINGSGNVLIGSVDTPSLPNRLASLTQPIPTNGKFFLAPNQLAANVWYRPQPYPNSVINGHIEGSFDHFDWWPNLNRVLRETDYGFGITATEIGHMQGATLLKFRDAGLPVTADPPSFTQGYDGAALAHLDFDGTPPSSNPDFWCNTLNFCGSITDRQDPRIAGWFRTRDGAQYTPDEIILDERMPNLVQYFDFDTIIGPSNPGETWEMKKNRARRDPWPDAANINPGVDRITGLINDYVEYANAMKLHFAPQSPPRLSLHWNVHPGWEWSDEVWLDQLHTNNPDPNAFETGYRYVQNPLHHDADHLNQLVKTLCASGTCPDTVYMDMELVYISETGYALNVLRRDKAVLAANNIKFGIDLVDACSDTEPGCTVNMAADGSRLDKITRDPNAYSVNSLYEESILNITNYLIINNIIDDNTKVRLGSWIRRPAESASAINENYISLSHTANRVINEYLKPRGYSRSWTRNGLAATYFDNADFTGRTITRIDPTVNFDWGGGSPTPSMGIDDFSVRWEGQLWAEYSEPVTFYTVSDDGIRLWINNQLLIDNWTDHGETENSGTINLVRGQTYNVRMDYYEHGGGATAKLLWSSGQIAKQVIPETRLSAGAGLSAEYFSNTQLSGSPIERVDPVINLVLGEGSPDARIPNDYFSARWHGQVVPRYNESYTFWTYADDGVRLWVNGQLIIDDWNAHPPEEHLGTITLQAGQHYDIRLEYWENWGNAQCALSWSSPTQPKEIVPESQLYPQD